LNPAGSLVKKHLSRLLASADVDTAEHEKMILGLCAGRPHGRNLAAGHTIATWWPEIEVLIEHGFTTPAPKPPTPTTTHQTHRPWLQESGHYH
jgi:hypothetical protein